MPGFCVQEPSHEQHIEHDAHTLHHIVKISFQEITTSKDLVCRCWKGCRSGMGMLYRYSNGAPIISIGWRRVDSLNPSTPLTTLDRIVRIATGNDISRIKTDIGLGLSGEGMVSLKKST